ncbi:MAG TPA: (Fe-S)-binding protein [Candidatus Hydrogenedentes bacterium]|nr:(Fe-S)-binding protein [Candidatus Hydrogenedentota bacterium]HOK88871.1 (Fe-S)-binding protein [Candidatus Hydrogenedentota bacterium]
MGLPIAEIIGTLSDNLRLRGSVMPLGSGAMTAWARGLDIPRGGETVLYTGHMYQLMPYTAAMEQKLDMLRDTPLIRYMKLGRKINQWINTTRFMPPPPAAVRNAWNRRLRNIARLLRKAGVTFGYLYEKEMYAGALVCDHGMTSVFQAHAAKVYAMLKQEGVKRIITVDPHTTDMLRSTYPKIIPGYDLEVKSYLEVLAERGIDVKQPIAGNVAIHDSCVYARYENVVEQPRALLKAAGAACVEPEASGKLTHCCGGPIESLYPEKTERIARERMDQLTSTGCDTIAAMCPICLLNLCRVAPGSARVIDISDLLVQTCCPEEAELPDTASNDNRPPSPVRACSCGCR